MTIALCEKCVPGDHEVLTVGGAWRCEACGRETRNVFRNDPRVPQQPATEAERAAVWERMLLDSRTYRRSA